VLRDGGDTAVYLADLIPTVAHLPLPRIMGSDLEPLRTLESKRRLLEEAVAGGWRLIYEHDPTIVSGIPVGEGKGDMLTATMTAGTRQGTDFRG
jgi:glyoxylase-like metal-dependent hydrolase (beta-lactamase superfamily II)